MEQWQGEEEAERKWAPEDLRRVLWNMERVVGCFLENAHEVVEEACCNKEAVDSLAVVGER